MVFNHPQFLFKRERKMLEQSCVRDKRNHIILSLLFREVAVVSLIHPGSWCPPSVLITPHNSTQCSAVLFDSKLCEMRASSSLKAVWDELGCRVISRDQTDLSGSKVHFFAHQIFSSNICKRLSRFNQPRESVSCKNSRQQTEIIITGKPSKLQSFIPNLCVQKKLFFPMRVLISIIFTSFLLKPGLKDRFPELGLFFIYIL